MKTYFVCSDIHGFYKEWMKSLKEAGFNKNNPEHILIVLGDIFDRGNEPWKVYKFLTSQSKKLEFNAAVIWLNWASVGIIFSSALYERSLVMLSSLILDHLLLLEVKKISHEIIPSKSV